VRRVRFSMRCARRMHGVVDFLNPQESLFRKRSILPYIRPRFE
jgi:hypothetical protein